MAHYAFVDENGIVIDVITGRNEDEFVDGISDWESYYSSLRGGLKCLRTSYNTHGGVHYVDGIPSDDQSKAFRKNYASIGYRYDEKLDAFIPQSPHESWMLNTETCLWESPLPYPEDGSEYVWDESSKNWILFTE